MQGRGRIDNVGHESEDSQELIVARIQLHQVTHEMQRLQNKRNRLNIQQKARVIAKSEEINLTMKQPSLLLNGDSVEKIHGFYTAGFVIRYN